MLLRDDQSISFNTDTSSSQENIDTSSPRSESFHAASGVRDGAKVGGSTP